MTVRFSIFLVWLLHFLPLPVLAWFGNAVGMLFYALSKERRHVADVNLELCFPNMSTTERKRLVRKHFRAFGRSFIERGILWWASPERINRLVRVEGIEHFHAEHGKPLILLTAHFVALDVGGCWLAQNTDVVTVYSKQKNPYFETFLYNKRRRFGNQLLYTRQDGMRPAIKAMRLGHPFYYFTDQDFNARDALYIPFFGVPANTLNTVSRIAAMTGAKVVPCISRVLPDAAGYEVRFYPPWENYPSGDDAADARRVNEFIEQRVLEMPEQYFWLHKRFKTRPEGEAKYY
ncbi:MAG: lipid A biosynthesis acyltransferase [Nitrosomonadales bacterium]|nr:lipid A biosynthesis acyltransferase [Nitrosomonadales bacterium]